jgi:tripartite-type tricarboxylate transporter receptor subunit TctC
MAALLGGEVQYLFTNPVSGITFAKQGRAKILAVTGSRRLPSLPDTPTMAEAGMKGFEAEGWFAYFGPPRMPGPIAEKLHQVISQAVKSPDMDEFLKAQGTIPTGLGLSRFAATLGDETRVWSELVRQNDIRID